MALLSRREVLVAAAATPAITAAGSLNPAQAAVRTVTKQVALAYTYDPETGITKVTRFRARQVVVRMTRRRVLQKKGAQWVRIPYVWSKKRHALVYSRKLHLAMMAASHSPATQPPTEPTPKPTEPPAPDPTPSPTPTPPPIVGVTTTVYATTNLARHALRRAGYGVSPQGLAQIKAAGGASAWLAQQLAPESIDDSECEAVLKRLPDQSEDIWAVQDAIATGKRSGWEQLQGVHTGHVIRAVWSRRQLQTVMEEFWANHFNVTVPCDGTEESRAHYQYTLRTHSLGRFADLLRAATMHPSMLTYLNNRESDDEHPNENHGRELLELHTVGIEAGYGEEGVLNSARILTGLSVDNESGEYAYKPWHHWTGPVQVLGFTHPNPTRKDGQAVAQAYLDYLAHHPATARRIATKLARRFVADFPPKELIDHLAAVYLEQDTAIGPVLRELFASTAFWASIGAKTCRPFESMVATLRVLQVGVGEPGLDHLTALANMAQDVGQGPFSANFPTGWPDLAAAWSSPAVTLNRWNNTRNLAQGGWPSELGFPLLRDRVLPTPLPATHGEAVDAMAGELFGMSLLPGHRDTVLAFLGKSANAPLRANSPFVTWQLADVVSLLLDSPYHHYR